MQKITINFGLIASEKFPAVARARVLTRGTDSAHVSAEIYGAALSVLNMLMDKGCVVTDCCIADSATEPTLVAEVLYPVSSEKAACAPPSVLKYSKYMRLYEVACEYAQDAVAVLEEDGTGLLVGANAKDWGEFDKTQFITIGE